MHNLEACAQTLELFLELLICDAYYDSLKETHYEATSYDPSNEGCLGVWYWQTTLRLLWRETEIKDGHAGVVDHSNTFYLANESWRC